MGGFIVKLKDCSAYLVLLHGHRMPPCYCLVQHVVVALLSAAEFGCRLIYLVLTGAFRTRVQTGNGCAITGKAVVVIGSACHVLSHRVRYELGHIKLLFLDRFGVGKNWRLKWKRLVLGDARYHEPHGIRQRKANCGQYHLGLLLKALVNTGADDSTFLWAHLDFFLGPKRIAQAS